MVQDILCSGRPVLLVDGLLCCQVWPCDTDPITKCSMTQHHDSASKTPASKCIAMTTLRLALTAHMLFLLRRRLKETQLLAFTPHYSTIQYSTVQSSTVQYSTVQCSTVQYSTVQYSTVQYTTPYTTLPSTVEGQLYLRLCLRLLMLRRSLERYPGSPAAATCVLSQSLRDPEAWRDLLFSKRLHCCSLLQ